LDLCRFEHIRQCISQLPGSTVVQHLKFIDCSTRQIVPAKNAAYVTLSYVWGQIDQDIEYSKQVQRNLPRTIEDALQVTLDLGFQYLWIDRYCINQQDKGHAYSQMSQMDLIYQNSEVTIVAAAGRDPNYGLPGVSERKRRRQAQAMIGSTVFTNPLKSTDALIANSEWDGRAWTYQEGLLARRLLLFTDDQVYFQCHYMHCYEAHQSLTEAQRSVSGKQTVQGIRPRISPATGVFPNRIDTGKNSICQRITEYSRRSLTRQSDRLNAFLGILEFLRREALTIAGGRPFCIIPPTNLHLHHHWEQVRDSYAAFAGQVLLLSSRTKTENHIFRVGHGLVGLDLWTSNT